MTTPSVLTVLGEDKTGIVARVATTLAEAGVNIEDIRQTILGNVFSMTMLVTIDDEGASFEDVQAELERNAQELGVQITLQREDVFRFMYRV